MATTKQLFIHGKNIGPLTFSINGKQKENVFFLKFLGIVFDEHLTWKNHITMITNKLSKVIGILNRLKNIYPQWLYSPYIIPYFLTPI